MSRQPALFVGHGNPMNAISTNEYTQEWKAIGERLAKPDAIVCVSAHWYLPGTLVTAMETPRTIHDFGGFPRPLYEVQYPAPGKPELVERIRGLLDPTPVGGDHEWGLDHGTWSVLIHIFPKGDVPVVQVSIDETQPAEFHYETGKRLGQLRDENILILGSGNLVHNLHAYAWGRHPQEPYDWAVRFETFARAQTTAGDDMPLVMYEQLGRDAMLSAPTPDHYLPLLYVLGARQPDDVVTFPVEGVDGGSVSMLSVQLG